MIYFHNNFIWIAILTFVNEQQIICKHLHSAKCILVCILCFFFLNNRFAGILSAYGMALADVVHEEQEPCAKVYKEG